MKTTHAWSLIVAFAVVICVGSAAPAAARLLQTSAMPDARAGDIATLSPARPPVGDNGDLGPIRGHDDPDGDPDDIMGGNNVVKGPMAPNTVRAPSVRLVVRQTLWTWMRAWISLGWVR